MQQPYLLISDVDDTLLGNDDALLEFVRFHRRHARQLGLVYASGRMVDSLARIINATPLPAPAAIIAAVGTEIRRFPALDRVPGWQEQASARWSVDRVRQILAAEAELTEQPKEAQSFHKMSYYLEGAPPERVAEFTERLRAGGIDADAVYSSARDLDFLPPGMNKGTAAAFLARYWQVPQDRVIVAGNSGNDAALFEHGFRGIIVGNADDDLRRLAAPNVYLARDHHARGVIEGVEHWMGGSKTPAV